MSANRLVVPGEQRPLRDRLEVFATVVAATVVLACGPYLARAAQASPAVEMGSGAAWAEPSQAASRAIPTKQPHPPDLAGRPPAADEGAAVLATNLIHPLNASTGLNLNGAVTGSWGPSGVRMTVGSVSNNRASGTSGTLRLELWATSALPIFGNNITGYRLGTYVLGTLMAGFQFTNVDSGFVTYFPPQDGCYYVTLFLDEFQNDNQYHYVDFKVFTTGGTPDGSGYDRFAFGSGTCNSVFTCVRDAQTACLVGGRFQVTASYTTASSSGPAQVMSFNAERAESDESVFLWFFTAANFEIGLKILPACAVNGDFWVFISGLTDQGWTVNIVDSQTGRFATYSNPLGHLTSTTADTSSPLFCP
jgi:hypothetical protein